MSRIKPHQRTLAAVRLSPSQQRPNRPGLNCSTGVKQACLLFDKLSLYFRARVSHSYVVEIPKTYREVVGSFPAKGAEIC